MYLFLYYLMTFLYLEILFKLETSLTPGYDFLYTFIYLSFLSILFVTITKLFKEKMARFICLFLSFLSSLWFCVEIIFKKTFGVYFSLGATTLADQALGFFEQAITIISSQIPIILLTFLPFFIGILFTHFYQIRQNSFAKTLKLSVLAFAIHFLFVLMLPNVGSNSLQTLYAYTQNNALNIERFGVLPSTFIEIKKELTGFEERIEHITIDSDQTIDENDDPQILDIDFDARINSENNPDIKQMHEYFKHENYSMKNSYTGTFEGKNLILFMAESFNGVVVDPELTPTLYKLVNGGFHFENFYSPVILSTIGGEFQELTGLYPNLNMLSFVWRVGNNYFPYGLGTLFKERGYETFAYHNHEYDFQDRNVYLKSLGFDRYSGCFNGLEEKIDCSLFPKSDDEMIKATINDYINKEHFAVYYATVSGHMNYEFTDNDMSIKHEKEVEHLPYSYRVRAYIATQIELDQALETLLTELEANGRLDDTVIALVGDHYPYALSVDEMNEMADTPVDEVVEINRSNFILYNSEMESINIEKVGSQIDVLPTLLNLFGFEYDSRLITGKDILDESTPGLAIFENRSWVSDLGTYYASRGEFIPKEENIIIPDDYIDKMNQIVSNRIAMSRNIMSYDYYRNIFQK